MPAATLSILCLTFNHEAYVARTLEGFLEQSTTFPVEVVVSDDCSTDRTVEIVTSFQGRFNGRLTLLTSAVNQGVTRNFRRAMAACQGRYIALCEGDDFWRGSRKLQQQVDFLDRHPDCVLTFHDAEIIDASGRSLGLQLAPSLRRDIARKQLQLTRPIPTLSTCFRNVLGALPPELDQAPALDMCLWSLLGHHGHAKYLAAVEPAVYRVHQGGVFSLQGQRSRYLMTAQSLLCLSRVYAREGQTELSDALLSKASHLAGSRLPPWQAAWMAGRVVVGSAGAAAYRVWRNLRRPAT